MADGTQVVQQAYESFARGDIPAVLELLSDDVDWSVPDVLPHGGHFQGRDDVGRFFQRLGELWENLIVVVQSLVAVGGLVVGIGRAGGMLRGAGEASFGFAHVFEVAGDRVVRFREFADPDPAARAG